MSGAARPYPGSWNRWGTKGRDTRPRVSAVDQCKRDLSGAHHRREGRSKKNRVHRCSRGLTGHASEDNSKKACFRPHGIKNGRMKFIIAVDCEGVACAVGSSGGSLSQSRNYPMACRQAVRETNAATRALFDSGAGQVIVWDNHNGSLNLDYEQLDERCDILLGTGFEHRLAPLDESFAGVLFIGYHSKDNVTDAPMAHSFNSKNVQWMKVNGREVGELAIDAAVAGTFGVPPLFVASDDKAVEEAKEFFPGITTVTTKTGYGWNAALSLHPRKAEAEIYEAVQKAVASRDQMRPFTFETPLVLERRLKRLDAAQSISRNGSGWERVDPHTVRKTLNCIRDLY